MYSINSALQITDISGEPQYYLFETVTEENKEKLKLVHFPSVKIRFEELFDIEFK